jgi:hypothetical protein
MLIKILLVYQTLIFQTPRVLLRMIPGTFLIHGNLVLRRLLSFHTQFTIVGNLLCLLFLHLSLPR